MKIIINSNETYEIKDEILTLIDFLNTAEKLKAFTTQIIETGKETLETETEKIDDGRSDIKEAVYKLKKSGMDNSEIAKKLGITPLKVKKLYKSAYMTKWHDQKKESKIGKIMNGNTTKRKIKVRWNDREEVVRLMKTYFKGTPEQRQKFADKKGMTWVDLTKVVHQLIKRYKITPQEVGVTELRKIAKRKAKNKINIQIQPKNQPKKKGRPVGWKKSQPSQSPSPKSESSQKSETKNPGEADFVKFFELYQKTEVNDELAKKAVLMLKEFLIKQGKTGTPEDIIEFLNNKFQKEVIPTDKIKSWVNYQRLKSLACN
jgi:hypothetical protein